MEHRHQVPSNDIFWGWCSGRVGSREGGRVVPQTPAPTMWFLIRRSKGAGGRLWRVLIPSVLELKYFCWMLNTRCYFWGLACTRLIVSRDEMQEKPHGNQWAESKVLHFPKVWAFCAF